MRAFVILTLLAAPTPTFAQSAAFEQGVSLARSGYPEAAEQRFREAYLRTGEPAALYERALVLLELERIEEAREDLRVVLHHGRSSPALLASARDTLRDVGERAASLELVGLAPLRHTIELDGHEIEDDGRRPFVLVLPPGEHDVRVSLAGHASRTWRGELGFAQTERLAFTLHPGGEPAERRDNPFANAWVWLGIAAAGVLTGVLGFAVFYEVDRAHSGSFIRF